MQGEEFPKNEPDGYYGDEDVGSSGCLWSGIGLLGGLFAGVVLFTATYPWDGSDKTPISRVAIVDGVVIVSVGAIAYGFRKKSSIAQGLLVGAAILFILNGLCGLGGMR